jgi:anti-sigma regulatory factor (Ser/Thr protein kinase)
MGRLRSDLDAPLLENVRLLVTELITNAVRHAHAEAVELVMVVSRTRVHVEVGNPGAGFEPRPSGPEDSDKGWGLFLVDRLSSDWGVAQESGTDYQRVWFVMARTA